MPIVKEPSWIGELALKILQEFSDGQIGKIAQIFKSTIYIRTNNDGLICITSYDVKGPVNVNVNLDDDADFRTIRMDEPVYMMENALSTGDLVLPLRGIPVHESRQDLLFTEGLGERVLAAADIINILAVEESLVDSKSPFFEAFSKIINTIVWQSKKAKSIDLSISLMETIGLGNGSTPSGDDFTAGFLYCLSKIPSAKNIKRLKIKDGKTTWQSRKFIEYAQNGFVIEPLETFVKSLLSGTKDSVTESILDLCRIGHSSGIDAAMGAVIACGITMNDALCAALLKKLGL